MNKNRTLIVGFDQETHRELSEVFELVCTVSSAETSTYNWNDVYYFKNELVCPTYEAMNDGSYEFVVSMYQRYADINSRRYVTVNARESEIFNGFMAYFYWAHKQITDNKVELLLFQNFPHESFDYIIYLIAKFFGLRTIVLHQCFLMIDRFWICEDIESFGCFDSSPVITNKVESGYELPEQWYYMNDVSDKWAYTLKDFVFDLLRKPWRLPTTALRYHYNRDYRKNRLASVKPFDEHDKFVYFPLHMQPELTTSSMGGAKGRYGDQVQAIEQLSMMVPPDVKIYLKENPKQTAQQRDPLFYKRISSLYNVDFVSPSISSTFLIGKSVGVATVTGTAGWESLFYGKPCLIFGNAWYSSFQGVTKFNPMLKFSAWIENTPPASEDLVKCLDELLAKTGRGVVDPLHAVVVPDFDVKNNAVQIASSLKRYLVATSGKSGK